MLFLSQPEIFVSNPIHAASPKTATKSLSSLSRAGWRWSMTAAGSRAGAIAHEDSVI